MTEQNHATGYELTPNARMFSPYHACPKCGNSSAGVASRHVTFGWIGADMIRRTCGRCSYLWDERPVDRAR